MLLYRIFISSLLILVLLLVALWFLVTQPLFFKADRVAVPVVNPEVLESHVRMLSEILPARVGIEEALLPTVSWIEKQLAPYGKTSRQSYEVSGEKFYNILMKFGQKSRETIIVGAHYDTAHGYPGADDNASGVAGLIELARLLSESDDKLAVSIELVFFSLEEPPYFRTKSMGSFIHASSLAKNQQNVRVMIALDMIGYFSDDVGSQNFPVPLLNHIYPNRGDFIAVVADPRNMLTVRKIKHSFKTASDLPVYSINAPRFIQGIDFSDHLNYWNYGYKSVLVTDTSFNRNVAYHTEDDVADRLDYVRLGKVVQSVYRAVLDYSQ